jgi:hypothetical protein
MPLLLAIFDATLANWAQKTETLQTPLVRVMAWQSNKKSE